MTKTQQLKTKIGSRSFDDGTGRRKGTPVEDAFNLATMLRVELGGRRVGAYVLKNGDRYQIKFGFECRGIHCSIGEQQIDAIFDALESGLKDFPQGETLSIHLSSFTRDAERQQQLTELINAAPSRELQFLLMGDRARVRELTETGIRKPKSLYLFASYSVDPETVNSSDIIEKLLDKSIKIWKGFTGELDKIQFVQIERMLAQAFSDGFGRWELLLSNKLGLDIHALDEVEMWQLLWKRFNREQPIQVPQTLILNESGLHESVNSDVSCLTLLLAEETPVADRRWVYVKDKYVGVFVFADKPGGWVDKAEQLRYLWSAISKDNVYDTEIITQLFKANDTIIHSNMQRMTRQAVSNSNVAGRYGTVDVQAGLNLKKTVEAQEALYEGSVGLYTSVVFLVYRDTVASLDDACRLLGSLFVRPAWLMRETEYPWLVWTQTFPCCWDKLLIKPFDRRSIYLNTEAPGLMPLVKPRAIDRTGLELISDEGGTPIFLDLYTRHRNLCLFGTTRSGKSVIASGILTQALAYRMPVVAMDYPKPDGTSTFTDYTQFMGGRGAYFNVSSESCNLFEVPDLSNLPPDQQKDRFEDYKDFLISALMTMVVGSTGSPLADNIRSILTLAVDAFYRDDQIRDRYKDAFLDGFGSDAWWAMPTLSDFIGYCSYERLRMDGVSEDIKAAMNKVRLRLNFWLTSRIGKSISKPSTFRSDAQLLIFALANLSNDEDAAILSLSAYSAALRRALSSPASVFFIDESPILFQYKEISNLVARLCANGAKAGVRVILSAQEPDSIANSPGGTKIFANMQNQLVGRIQPTAVDSFVEILKYPREIIAQNATEGFFPKKEGIYSQWLINDMGTFTRARFYPGYPLLAAVANNPDEQAARTAVLARSPDKFTAFSEFAQELVAKIRSS